MPRIKLTKSAIDALPTPSSDVVYWDAAYPGFGMKITPKGRKVFIVLYRTGGAGSYLRKYTIGPYGRVTLHQARVAAQKVFAAKLEGRDPAAERHQAKRRAVGRSGRGSAGGLYHPACLAEPLGGRDLETSSTRGRKALGRAEHPCDREARCRRSHLSYCSARRIWRRQQNSEVAQNLPALVRWASRA
jgi:Arm DNA-binding domain